MNSIKKVGLTVATLVSLTTFNSSFCVDFEDDFDQLLNDPEAIAFLEENEFTFVRKSFTPKETVEILYDMNIVSILEENLFLRTNPLNKRDIIDLPIGMLNKSYSRGDWVIGFDLFLNKTDRSFFSQCSDGICSYLALTKESFLAKLDAAAKKVAEFNNEFDFDPADVLLLFANATIQERRAGFLVHGKKSFGNWSFAWKIPFYYLESNYWFTEEEQDAIEEELGATTEEEQERLQDNHLISDKLGFGDLRIRLTHPGLSHGVFSVRVGLMATLPISLAFAKGVIGNHYKAKCDRRSDANLKDLIGYHLDEILDMAIEDELQSEDEAYRALRYLSYETLDNLSANLLDTPLGNGRHLGIGVCMESKTPLGAFLDRNWADKIFYKGFMSFEYLFPATEMRFFSEYIDERLFRIRHFEDYDNPGINIDESRAQSDMEFLEQQLINKLMPYHFETRVHPGIVFRWTGVFVYESKRFGMHLGTDMWIKSKERLSSIKAPEKQLERLKIEKARRLFGYQSKIIGSLFYVLERSDRNWTLAFNADYTWWSSGIGRDWTITFNLEVDF